MSDDANNDPLSSLLGINPIQTQDKINEIIIDAHNDSAQKDFETARANINVMIDTAKDAIENLSQIASSSQAPRAYEVLAKLIETTVQANKDLIDLQAKMKEMKDIDVPNNPKGKTINNNLFVGSTAELQKVLQDLKGK